jgi:hypothetical protein
MSPTNQFEKTKEETRTKRLRVEASTEEKRPDKRSSEGEVKPSVRKEDTPSSKELSPEKEQRRRRSASAEVEMTETLKQTRRQQKKMQKIEKRKNKKPRLRIFPIWLRIVVVGALSVAALAVGLMIGYGGLGEGEARDVLEWETWQHIIDIIFKAE